MDPKKKFFLFHQSQSFCSVPWNYFKIDADGTIRTCVQGREILGNINNQDINEILDNPILRRIRQDLYHDKIPQNCTKCRALDQTGSSYSYLRSMYNDWFKSSDVDYSDFDSFHLSGLDLHWSSTCNLKCVTCWSKQSSAIAKELRLPILHLPSDRAQQLINWAVEQQHQLKEIYFSGGEPTLIRHNIGFLERLQPRSDLLIRVNTNMAFDMDNRFINLLSKFPNVLYTLSADAMSERFDYIRQGASWSKFLQNLDFLRKRHDHFRINSVFFVASAFTLIDTQQFFRENYGFEDFTINQCGMEQDQLLCRNLPDQLKKDILARFQAVIRDTGLDQNLRGQIQNCMIELENDPNTHDYRAYFDHIDQRRGTNWRNIFRELA